MSIGSGGLALVVVAICFVMNLLARGFSETYAVFLLPLEQDFGWRRAELTGVYSTYMLVHGLSAPFAGALFDRLGPRFMYGLGLLCLGGGYFFAARLTAVWQFHLCVGALGGIGVASMGMIPASALISRWFRERLGTAMGVAYAGLGTGVIVVVPATQWVIERHGWRFAYTTLGTILLAALPLTLLLPWRRLAAGQPRLRAPGGAGPSPGWTLRRAMGSTAFWGLFAVFFFTAVAIYTISIQVVAYLVEIGFAPLEAATAFGIMGTLSVAGMVGTGWFADRAGRRRTVTVTFCLTLSGIGLLFALDAFPYYWLLIAFVLCFGASQGSRGPVISTLCAELFPGGGLGAIYGAVTLGMGLGAGLGAWVSGWLRDLTGGYQAGFAFSAVAALLGLAQFWIIPALSRARGG
ncbi:MAG: MFS transporter [Gammaproteobacteria bacterium]|nr:MFS transporter [Gammaproteobacteria bacterium]